MAGVPGDCGQGTRRLEGSLPGGAGADRLSLQVFGIRHHGPGSARSLLEGLERLQPDAVLVEGPPDADTIIPLAGHQDIKPPVAILVYPPDKPSRAVFYPFAVFSPEWQALRFALARDLPVRFIDLPVAVRLALEPAQPDEDQDGPAPGTDPIGWLAQAAGEPDPERWWERMVEQRGLREGVFDAIREAMTALREAAPPHPQIEARREAHMRQAIRAADKEGFERIAVVCGAWHAPALAALPPAAADARLLQGLARTKVDATWIPWTHGRLALASGYGAGVESPGWYHHLWTQREEPILTWMATVAQLLRAQDLDASAAQVIDAIRLAETTAAMRGRSVASLAEVIEAVRAVLCQGSDAPIALIRQQLIVGELLGELPAEAPVVPLQRDLEQQQRRLRLRPEALERVLDLDLRTPSHLEGSHLLHRLAILQIPWAVLQRVDAGKKGTFHEIWKLAWRPEVALAVIEAGIWGNTVEDAARARAVDRAATASDLKELASLLDAVLLADLAAAVAPLVTSLNARSALATDVGQLMEALPALAGSLRYGSVRQTDADQVATVIEGLAARIVVGLPPATGSLDDDAAAAVAARVRDVHRAFALLDRRDLLEPWLDCLQVVLDRADLHGLVGGRVCRLLFDASRLDAQATGRRLGLALSRASEPAHAAAWFEGFLEGGALVLTTDDTFFQLVDSWLCGLRPDDFAALLPILRRAFASMGAAERRQIAERAKAGTGALRAPVALDDLDPERVALVEPILRLILGAPDA